MNNQQYDHLISKLSVIDMKLDRILRMEKKEMADLKTLQDEVAAEDTVIDSAVTLINGLAAQVAALKPDQQSIDALAADIKAKSDSLASAVQTNTLTAPAP